jgi:hypothetical protein
MYGEMNLGLMGGRRNGMLRIASEDSVCGQWSVLTLGQRSGQAVSRWTTVCQVTPKLWPDFLPGICPEYLRFARNGRNEI